jgi:hypothetical protein
MRIVIEIDGTPVAAKEVPAPASHPEDISPASSEPPAELARAARAIGALSAGPAGFVKPAGLAEFRTSPLATTGLAADKKPRADLDAGIAAAIPEQPSKIRGAARKRLKKSTK